MRARGRLRGLTLIETVVSTLVGFLVIFAATRLLLGAGDLTDSINHSTRSEVRADHALWTSIGVLRCSSLDSAEHLDGTPFEDGNLATGLSVLMVEEFEEGVPQGDRLTLRWDRPLGATEGTLVLEGGGLSRTLARGVTEFSVRRDGDGFRLTLRAESGPPDDRRRGVRRGVTVTPRTP